MITKIKENKEYIILFLVVLGICFLFPYSWDDWSWGSKIGLERLDNWFDSYGGRYFGNIMALVLTRSKILRSVLVAVSLALIVYLLNKLSKNGKVGSYITIIALLFMPITLLRESVVWASGFANYGISIVLTLIYICFIRNIYNDEEPKYPIYSIPLVLILGFLNTLLIEHMTIFNVVLGIYAIVLSFIKYRKLFVAHLAYLIGCVVGTIWMFSNSAYTKFATAQDPERSISGGGGIIERAVNNYFRDMAGHGFLNNLVVNALLLMFMILLYKKVKEQLTKKLKIVGTIAIVVVIIQVAFSFMNAVININSNELGSHGFPTSLNDPITLLQYMQGIAGALFMIAIVMFICILPLEKIERVRLLFIPTSIAFIMAPLTIVVPIGGRCFFATYILFIWLVLEFYKKLDIQFQEAIAKKAAYFRTVIAVALVFFIYIYGTIFVANHDRLVKAREDIKQGKDTIELKDLPYQQYVHGPNPIWDEELAWHRKFKLFYNLDPKVKILNIHKYSFIINEPETTTQK